MAREQYQAELDELRANVVEMGELILDQLDDGLAALAGDEELGEAVVASDEAVNERYLELEADCIDLFALQQPVAGDLRFVTSSFKILTDLERVGDLATNFGSYALAGESRRLSEADVETIGAAVHEQVADALDAYERSDPAACRAVAARDDEVDALCQAASERLVRDLVEHEAAGDSWAVERLLDDVSRVLLTVRDLERVGDHAVNVAARALYATESDAALLY